MAPQPATPSSPPLDAALDDVLAPGPLIDASRPRPRVGGSAFLFPLAVVAMLVMAWPSESAAVAAVRTAVVPLLMLGAVAAFVTVARRQGARVEAEARAVELLEELTQLRRWPEAADLVRRLLGGPMFSPERRMQALMSLAAVLQRYHRFADARVVHDYLLDPPDGDPVPDGSTAHAVKVARAMSLLRDDHLVDADRAMGDLRRDVKNARDEARRQRRDRDDAGEGGEPDAGEAGSPVVESAGLLLLDLYRDVKTNHNAEAAELFESRRKPLRDQLGHRFGDALVLAATAYDALGRRDEAAATYADATRLAPPVELHRRYPETARLASTYEAATTPATPRAAAI